MSASEIFIEGHKVARVTRKLFNTYRAAFSSALRSIYAGLREMVTKSVAKENGAVPEGQFYEVVLEMTDRLTGKKIERVIDKLNAFSNGKSCWELRGINDQRKGQ